MTNCNSSLLFYEGGQEILAQISTSGRAMNLSFGPGSEFWALPITSAVFQLVQF